MPNLLLLLAMILALQSAAQNYDHVFVFLNNKPDKKEISDAENEALQKAHMENIELMVAAGKLNVAGPFADGGGIFILNTGSVAEARQWLTADPAIKANRWDIEIFPVNFLKGSTCLAPEPYEMVSYDFIRVNFINDIANHKVNDEGFDIWQRIIDVEAVLMTGIFPNKDGGVFVYSGETRSNWFGEKASDQLSLEFKTVWVAKGSFCE